MRVNLCLIACRLCYHVCHELNADLRIYNGEIHCLADGEWNPYYIGKQSGHAPFDFRPQRQYAT